jgi:diguanylate cyclase (GGDEF)-like protein
MDLDTGIKAARNGRWSNWWAEAWLLANELKSESSTTGERGPADWPADSACAPDEQMTGDFTAHEFFTVFSCSCAYVLLLDPSFKILAASRSFRDSRVSAHHVEGSNFIDLLDGESQLKARSFLETLAYCPSVIELEHRAPTDKRRRVTYCFCRAGDSSQTKIIAAGRDQEDPLELVKNLVRLDNESEESRHVLSTDDTTDALTGLGNRRWLYDRLDVLWREADRQGLLVWVMMADVDHFKSVNHAFGREAGDEVLKTIATMLHRSIRAGDWVCRYGGDGFLLAGACRDESEMPGLAGRMLSAIRGLRFEGTGLPSGVTVSLGAALAHPIEPCEPWVVLHAADRAVHRAKDAGRDRYDVEPGVLGRPEFPCDKPNPRFR